MQAYAGTAAPINFNGLVRQYDLRQLPEQGDLQVNLVDRKHRSRKSHEIALAVRPALEAIGARHQAKVKVVEVPPGPPVLSPIVAEIYGPDEAGRHALAKGVRAAFGQDARHRRHRRLDRGQRAADAGARRPAQGGAGRRSRRPTS